MAKHLTPDERAQIVARYVETANASQVAREFGVNETTVRKQVARAKGLKKSELHTRAVAVAIRKARRSLARRVESIEMYLLNATDEEAKVPGVIGLEPRDFAAVLNAQCNVTSKLMEVEERIEQRKLSSLTRELRRKEIELANLKIAAGGVEKHEHTVVTPDLAATLAREVFGSPSALESKPDGSSQDRASDVAGNVLPLPAPVDK